MSKQLSANFSESEFECPCCQRAIVQPALIVGLESLRAKLGAPITINRGGGYRCTAYNATVGGATHSQHVLGMAADISSRNVSGRELYELASQVLGINGIGLAPTWLHVDVRSGPRVLWMYEWNAAKRSWTQIAWK